MNRFFVLLLGSALALSAAGCSDESELMEEASGKSAPDFVLPDLDGQPWQLSQARGQVLLINFWATWCEPCRREMPALARLHEAMADENFQVIGIHVGPSTEIKRFLVETPVGFPILIDAELALADWNVPMLPATFLIDAEGRARYWAIGEREWDSPEAIEFFSAVLD
ncbi:MAG: TlpA disulfide reductase family protein [Gammaproteobacteria bacterium]|nr:TlpA disulfide reductase family protein [Gammaproteobacteria bacterium]